MAAKIPHPVIHIFKEVNKGKYKTVQHFDLEEVIKGTSLLSEKVNLSKDQNYALSMPDYWLKIRIDNKWSRNLTGLFKTSVSNFYHGDLFNRTHKLIFQFKDVGEILIVYYYPNFYTRNIEELIKGIIKKAGA